MFSASVGRPGADHHLQLVALAVEQADREVVEVHQVAREADDLVFQQLQPLADVHLAQRVGFEAHQLAAGLVDRVDLLLQAPRAGRVPHDGDDLHDLPAGLITGEAIISRNCWSSMFRA